MLSLDFSVSNLETHEARKLGTFLSVSNLEAQEAHKLLETFNICQELLPHLVTQVGNKLAGTITA
jgi:hypothetical protein